MCPELEEIRRELHRATGSFSGDAWTCAPAGKWNSSLIVEHLLLSYLSTTMGLLKVLQSQPSVSRVAPRTRIAVFLLTRLNYFPRGRKAPPQAIPKGRLQPGRNEPFERALHTMDQRLSAAEARFGSRARVLDHPEIGPLSVGEWRRFHRTHGLHHIAQIAALGRAQQLIKNSV